jgi:hypothetical protein
MGQTSPSVRTGATEFWNGTSWTSNPTGLNTAREQGGGCGTQTVALAFGGAPYTAATEVWNGTTWTNSASMATARRALGGVGTQAAGLAFSARSASGYRLKNRSLTRSTCLREVQFNMIQHTSTLHGCSWYIS